MIKGINATGRYVTTSGGHTTFPYVNMYNSNMGVGNLRLNPSSQNFEVYDGASWQPIYSLTASVGLTSEAESLLDWARQKRDKEAELDELAKKHPAIKDLQEKLELMTALVKNYESETQ